LSLVTQSTELYSRQCSNYMVTGELMTVDVQDCFVHAREHTSQCCAAASVCSQVTLHTEYSLCTGDGMACTRIKTPIS